VIECVETRFGAQSLRFDPEDSQLNFSHWWRQISGASQP